MDRLYRTLGAVVRYPIYHCAGDGGCIRFFILHDSFNHPHSDMVEAGNQMMRIEQMADAMIAGQDEGYLERWVLGKLWKIGTIGHIRTGRLSIIPMLIFRRIYRLSDIIDAERCLARPMRNRKTFSLVPEDAAE